MDHIRIGVIGLIACLFIAWAISVAAYTHSLLATLSILVGDAGTGFLLWTGCREWEVYGSLASIAAMLAILAVWHNAPATNDKLQAAYFDTATAFENASPADSVKLGPLAQSGAIACGDARNRDIFDLAYESAQALYVDPMSGLLGWLFGWSEAPLPGNACARDYIRANAITPSVFMSLTNADRIQLHDAGSIRE